MSYAIFRVQPINKLKDLKQIGSHNLRSKQAYQSNPDIDQAKVKDNITLIECSNTYYSNYMNLVDLYKKQHEEKMNTQREDRKKSFNQMLDDSNSVIADEMLFTSDLEFFKNMTIDEIKQWGQTCMEFVYQDLGYKKEQVLHSVIHLDEKTPHVHCVVVPLVKKFDKRSNQEKYTISKKQYIKDQQHLSELQDKYHARMVQNGYDLDRGIKNSDTQHISIKEFKKITRKLDQQLTRKEVKLTETYNQIDKIIKNKRTTLIGDQIKIDEDTHQLIESFQKQAKKIIEETPKTESLLEELKDYTSRFKNLERENQNIKVEVYKLKQKNNELEKENNRLLNFLHNIFGILKSLFKKLLGITNEKENQDIANVLELLYEKKIYTKPDLIDITENTKLENQIINITQKEKDDLSI